VAIKRMIGLSGWIREINRNWAELFDVVDTENGPALVAINSTGKKQTVLISMADVDHALGGLDPDKEWQDTPEDRCRKICQRVLGVLPHHLNQRHALDQFLRMGDLLREAIWSYTNSLPITKKAWARMEKERKNSEEFEEYPVLES